MNLKKSIKHLSTVLRIIVLMFSVLTGFSQTYYNFTNAGGAGTAGPSQSQVNTAYASTNLSGKVTITGSGIQQWVVPVTGIYSLTTAGASGGYTPNALGGKGRVITTQVILTAGTVINVLVGQEGGRAQFAYPGYSGGGGGGTFIINQTTNTPLLISGGGGGAGEGVGNYSAILPGIDASVYNVTSGGNGTSYSGSWAAAGIGGTNASGGTSGSGGSGGAGYNENGKQGSYGGIYGNSYINGGLGGINKDYYGSFTLDIPGGFGGGAGAGIHYTFEADAGGGGGYSGGGGGATRVGGGGGGGNLYTGTYLSSSTNTGNGYATITLLYSTAGGLNFNGNNDNVSLNSSVGNVGAGDFTLQMDVNTGAINEYFFSKRNDCNSPSSIFSIGHSANGTVGIEMYGGTGSDWGIEGNISINYGWHHLAFVRKSGTVSIYVDGVLDVSGYCNANINSSSIATLGLSVCTNHNGNAYFQGGMDEVRIWSRALCAAEINSNMSCELPAGQTGLVNYYKFNQGYVNTNNAAVTTLHDEVGGADGTLNNFALTGATSNWVAGNATGNCSAFVIPTAAITGVTSVCVGSTTALANTNTGVWTSSSAIATVSSTGVVTGVSVGTATITFTTDCGGVSTATVTVNPLPTLSGVVGASICSGTTATLTATSAASGPIFNWYNAATGGISLFTGDAYTTPALSAATTYYVDVTNSTGCTSVARTPVAIVINALSVPVVLAGGPLAFCAGGSVVLSANPAGNALQLTGTNYAQSTNPALPVGNASRTLEAWIKTTNTNSGSVIANWGKVSAHQRFGLMVAYGHLYFVGQNDDLSGSINIADGAWHHVAATYDGTTVRIFVDGVADGSKNIPLNTVDNTLLIGQRALGDRYDEYFTGTIDEVRIWNTAKTQAQLQANMNLSVASNSAGLVAYYKMDDAVGTTISDASVNNVTSTIYGGALTIESTAPINKYNSYLWSNGSTSSSITASAAGNYTVTVTNANGCTSASAATVVTVNPLPTAVVTATGSTWVCPSGNVPLTVVASAGSGTISTYSWLMGTTPIAATNSAAYIASATGNYSVTVTNTNGCAITSNVIPVTLSDTTRPIVITASKTVTLNASGQATISVTDINNGTTDNCSIPTLALNKTTFNYSNIGSNTVTLTATDNSGNVNTGTAIVTVLANGLNANGQMITNQSAQVNQYGAKGSGQARTPFGQVFGTVIPLVNIAGGLLPLNFTTYTGTGATPAMPSSGPLTTGTVAQLNFDWNGGAVLNSGRASTVEVHFVGNIVWPGINGHSKTVTIYDQSDDGFVMSINNTSIISNWQEQGGGSSPNYNGSGTITLTAGVIYPIDIWYYQNQGGDLCKLLWNTGDGNGTVIVPATTNK